MQKYKILLTITIAMFALASSVQAATATFRDGDAGYTGTEDTWLYTGAPYNRYNSGTNDSMFFRNKSVSTAVIHNLLRFDITGLGSVTNLSITSATIELYGFSRSDTNTNTVTMHEIVSGNADWVEGTHNFTDATNSGESTYAYKKDATDGWVGGQNGCGAATDYNSTILDTVAFDTLDQYETFTITDATMLSKLEDWADGTATNAGFVFFSTDSSNDNRFQVYSSDATNVNKPRMTITYTPEPATMALLMLGLPLALRRRRK